MLIKLPVRPEHQAKAQELQQLLGLPNYRPLRTITSSRKFYREHQYYHRHYNWILEDGTPEQQYWYHLGLAFYEDHNDSIRTLCHICKQEWQHLAPTQECTFYLPIELIKHGLPQSMVIALAYYLIHRVGFTGSACQRQLFLFTGVYVSENILSKIHTQKIYPPFTTVCHTVLTSASFLDWCENLHPTQQYEYAMGFAYFCHHVYYADRRNYYLSHLVSSWTPHKFTHYLMSELPIEQLPSHQLHWEKMWKYKIYRQVDHYLTVFRINEKLYPPRGTFLPGSTNQYYTLNFKGNMRFKND